MTNQRFYSIQEINKMPTEEKKTTVFCIAVIMGMGLLLSIAFYADGHGIISLVPFLGMTVLAWERKNPYPK